MLRLPGLLQGYLGKYSSQGYPAPTRRVVLPLVHPLGQQVDFFQINIRANEMIPSLEGVSAFSSDTQVTCGTLSTSGCDPSAPEINR